MKWICPVLVFVLAFMFAPLASAQAWNDTDLAWTFSTTCSDGSPASNCAVTSVRVERATTATGPWSTVTTLTGAPTSYRVTGLPAGTHHFRVIALAGTTESTPSTPVSKTNTAPAPGQPTLRVVNATAWEVRPNSTGTMVATRIGVVPLNAVCGAEQRTASGVTYTRVDPGLVDLINFPAAIPPVDVFAKCG